MDDELARPTAEKAPAENEDGADSGDEDGGLDWTKLSKMTPQASRPVIPKRGEKDFEPIVQGGSGLQMHFLDRARAAMLDALRATRTTSSKSISHGIWTPSIARVHVTAARGIHFSSMGHSVNRTGSDEEALSEVAAAKAHKRLELLPEEAIYLIERGAMFCWKEVPLSYKSLLDDTVAEGAPMTVQQAYSEMIGTVDLTLERYQAFAYLKRLGYVVTRTEAPTPDYPLPPPFELKKDPGSTSIITRVFRQIRSWIVATLGLFWRGYGRPLDTASLFKSLRIIPSGHGASLNAPRPPPSSPYKIFWNVYKPITGFKKTSPPKPDFSVVVVDARTTPMPSLSELTELFGVLPEMPLPPPRQRQQLASANKQKPTMTTASTAATTTTTSTGTTKNNGTNTTANTVPIPEKSWKRKWLPWIYPQEQPTPTPPQTRKVNPFAALKAGKKTVVIAVVDAGNIGFYRFSEGAFDEWPMQ